MDYLAKVCGIATAAIALTAVAPSAAGQCNMDSHSFASTLGRPLCLSPLDNREGHAIRIARSVARRTLLGHQRRHLYELPHLRNGQSEWRSALGRRRPPQARRTVVFQLGEGKLAPIITDGKVTGVTGTGRGSYVMAVGTSSSLAGKSFTYSSKPDGPGRANSRLTSQGNKATASRITFASAFPSMPMHSS